MQLTLVLTTLTTLATMATAINVRAFSGLNCKGAQWICSSIPSGTCCNFPIDFYSMQWTLPAATRGTGYTFDHCILPYPSVSGALTNACFNYLGLIQPSSGKWTRASAKRSEIHARQQDDKCENCADPDVLVYTTPEGKTRVIDIPAAEISRVAELVKGLQWKSLDRYLDSKKDIDLSSPTEIRDLEAPKQAAVTVKA